MSSSSPTIQMVSPFTNFRSGLISVRFIGEPGTQLTLRTFHAGGVAGNAAANASIVAKNDSRLEFDELRTVPFEEKGADLNPRKCEMVVSRLAEVRFIDPNTNIVLSTLNVPYGSSLSPSTCCCMSCVVLV